MHKRHGDPIDKSPSLAEKIKDFKDFDDVSRDALIAGSSNYRSYRSPDLDPQVITVFDQHLINALKEELHSGAWDLEVGFGKGRFLLEYAAGNPSRKIIGIEVRRAFCNRVMKRVRKRRLENVRVVLGDAREMIPKLIEEVVLERVFILFPDPWWKKRHAKRRYGKEFFLLVGERMKRGGILVIKSDVRAYLEDLTKEALDTSMFRIGEQTLQLPDTNREVRLREEGLPVFQKMLIRS